MRRSGRCWSRSPRPASHDLLGLDRGPSGTPSGKERLIAPGAREGDLVSRTHAVAVIAGDGIGPEVVREGLRVLERVASVEGFAVRLTRYPFGADHYLETQETLPDPAFDEIRGHDAILLGAIGDPRVQVGYLEFGIIA